MSPNWPWSFERWATNRASALEALLSADICVAVRPSYHASDGVIIDSSKDFFLSLRPEARYNESSHVDRFRIDDTATFHHTILDGAFGACRTGIQGQPERLPTPATGTATTRPGCPPHPDNLAPQAPPRCHHHLSGRRILPACGPPRPSHRYAPVNTPADASHDPTTPRPHDPNTHSDIVCIQASRKI